MIWIGLIGIAFLIALALVIAETPISYDEAMMDRFRRDRELRDRHDEFVLVHGREPSASELWQACPPR